MPLVQIATAAMKKAANKMKKKTTGKPKGRSPSMVLGSSSKAGMQSKQGKRPKRGIDKIKDIEKKPGKIKRKLSPAKMPNQPNFGTKSGKK